ncbi:MAG: flippase-like domain-containing protein [Polyangiaceae bacterium]|nr:flippase-like domain-containing protein [Polyangiaceae bacterium]
MTQAPRRAPTLGRALSWAIALLALGFVAWIIPLRDRCHDPRSPRSTEVAVSRDAGGGCVLHIPSGDVSIGEADCGALRCEPGVVSTLGGARWGVLVGLLAVYALGTFAWAARWRALLGFAGVDLRITQVWRLSIEAQAGGVLLPGGVGGDAFRIASILGLPPRAGEARPPLAIVIASVLLDRAIGLSVLAAVAVSLAAVFAGGSLGSIGRGASALLLALAAIPIAAFAGLVALRAEPGSAILKFLQSRRNRKGRVAGVARALEAATAPVLTYVRDPRAPRAIAEAACWSVLVAASSLVVVRGIVFALGAAPSEEKWVYVGTAMAFIVTAIPALPGGWGTADATYVFFFGLGGMTPGVALSVCLLFRLFWYASAVVGAVMHLAAARPVPRVSSTS